MCCEIVAFGAYALSEYPTTELAEAALACEMTGTSADPVRGAYLRSFGTDDLS